MRNTLDMDATIKGFDLEKDNLENTSNTLHNLTFLIKFVKINIYVL